MSLIHNERTKLTATYFNGIAIAVFAVGGFAPVIATFSSAKGPTIERWQCREIRQWKYRDTVTRLDASKFGRTENHLGCCAPQIRGAQICVDRLKSKPVAIPQIWGAANQYEIRTASSWRV